MTAAVAKPRIAPPGAARALHELFDNLSALQATLRALLDAAETKLAAMRRADNAALHAGAAREHGLLEQVLRLDRERGAILARAAQELRRPDLAAATLGELAAALDEPEKSRFLAKNAALKDLAATLKKKNDLAGRVARNLQCHIRAIFADIAKVAQTPTGYGPAGRTATDARRVCLDAVG